MCMCFRVLGTYRIVAAIVFLLCWALCRVLELQRRKTHHLCPHRPVIMERGSKGNRVCPLPGCRSQRSLKVGACQAHCQSPAAGPVLGAHIRCSINGCGSRKPRADHLYLLLWAKQASPGLQVAALPKDCCSRLL